MQKRIAVVGQGYVGLPVAEAFVNSGYKVTGLDSSSQRCEMLLKFNSGIQDVSSGALEAMFSMGYTVKINPDFGEMFDYVIICVPTPLAPSGKPDISYIETAAKGIVGHLEDGATVILESTTYPGTTEEVVLPILESSGLVHDKDFFLAFSPERIDPGNKQFNLRNTPKIVGGQSLTASSKTAELYQSICEEVVIVSSTREAEMAKLLENTYRHVNIALINELAIACDQLGINVREVVSAARTKPFGFHAFEPGPGVGGHCIPIDPNYLSFKVEKDLGRPFEFVSLATKINSEMPAYVARRVNSLLGEFGYEAAKVLVIGVSYKKDVSDTRETPATRVIEIVSAMGHQVEYHDPFVASFKVGEIDIPKVVNLQDRLEDFDLVLILQNHSGIDWKKVETRSRKIFDTRGVCDLGLENVYGF
jgi:UDP-N-acetyl-D-glucosamine dehydrogenase